MKRPSVTGLENWNYISPSTEKDGTQVMPISRRGIPTNRTHSIAREKMAQRFHGAPPPTSHKAANELLQLTVKINVYNAVHG